MADKKTKLVLVSCCAPCSCGAIKQLKQWQDKSHNQSSPPVEGWPTAGVGFDNKSDAYFNLPFNPDLKQRARELRKAGSLPEALLWKEIKNKKLNGLDFDRQFVIGNYIVDFFCPMAGIIIEIDDKASHDMKWEYDEKRHQYLENLGLTVIHIPASDVLKKPNSVFLYLQELLKAHPVPAGHPSTGGELNDFPDIADFIVLFYNPNIYPDEEYQKRLAEQVKYCESLGVKYHIGNYDHNAWLDEIRGFEDAPERGSRCAKCFKHRFRYAQKFALDNGYNAIASVLGVSRHKSQNQVDDCAREVLTEIRYIPIHWDNDLKCKTEKAVGFYRQNYCGCEFSIRK